ncbi:hypothetical protein CPB85DRAFT_1436671 [Mucidula mucida]|nr:hypothetical protein CPB85DRAFT_1436671 [Mucidula mucida]
MDVVPANFLCDHQTMQKITNSRLVDEKAPSLLELNLSVLELRQRRLKAELTAVELLISEAVAEQTRLRSSIETHKSLLAYSPVRALPGEILSKIFLHYIAVSQPTLVSFRSAVAGVLQLWLILGYGLQSICLVQARTWTTRNIGITVNRSYSPMITGSTQERASYWKALENPLKQTSSLPLQLLFHFSACSTISNHDDTISSLQTFIHLFPQGNTIFLYIYSDECIIPEFSSVMSAAKIPHADQVHTARINVWNSVLERKLLSVIPNIEVLEVDTWNIDQWFADVPTAGHCLRSFHLLGNSSSISLAALFDLLDRPPLLETLKVAAISITRAFGTLRTVTHTLLSTFHLSHATKEENNTIFGHLTLPALCSLCLGATTTPGPVQIASHFFNGLVGCLVALLTAQNKLTSLRINLFTDGEGDDRPIPMPILEFLSATPNVASDQPLPVLTILGFPIVVLREVDIEVQSREIEDDVKRDERIARFKAFTDKGMTIRISYMFGF